MWNISKIPHLFITTWPTTSAASRNSFQSRTKGAYANNQHQLDAEIKENPRKTSFYRAIKLCVGVLLILDSDATPFTRSLGATPFQVSVARLCQRSDLQQGFNKISHSNCRRLRPFSYIWFQLWLKTPWNCAFFSLPGFSIMAQDFCHVFLLLFGYFCRWHFFLHFHLRLVWSREKMEDLVLLWRIHRGGRAWLGTSWASNGKWYHSCRFVSPLHSQFFFRK